MGREIDFKCCVHTLPNMHCVLSYLRHPDMQYISMACTLDYVELTEKLASLQAQVKEEHVNFDKFWSEHKTLLDRVMNFSLFDRLVIKVKFLCT